MRRGQRMTDEQRARCSSARTGHLVSDEARERISMAAKKAWSRPEVKKRHSAGLIGNTNSLGKKLTGNYKKKVYSIKVCRRCGREYSPIGSLQKYCPECKLVGNREKKRSYGVEYCKENAGKIGIWHSNWYKENIERSRISHAKWSKENPEKIAIKHNKRRSLGFVPLNARLVGYEGHHVDSERVIYMPRALHRSVYHRQYDGLGMDKINAVAFNFLFKQEVEAAMSELLFAEAA